MSIKDPYIFKLKMNEYYDTSSVTLDAALADKYTDEVVELAKQLKAKNLSQSKNFSDAFYLDYAKSIKIQQNTGRSKQIYKDSIADCIIKDSQWAGYSYEEIIEMENSGYEIPEEVRRWAHAQQSADVTDYVMVSEDASTDDNTSTEQVKDDTDLNSLQKKAKQYITKSEKAQEQIEVQYEEHRTKVRAANKIKKQKEDNYKDSMEKISEQTKEWKELDDKKKQGGHLSFVERIRYNHLSKILDATDGRLMKELQANSADLDAFLESMDLIEVKNAENITLGQETVKAGEDLSQLEKTYHKETNETRGVVYSDMGTLQDSLYGVKGDEISKIAIQTGKDLEAYSDTIDADLTSDNTVELSNFAQDYTSLATRTQEKIANKDQDETEDKQKEDSEKKSEFTGYSVSGEISYTNSKNSAKTTAKAAYEVLSHNSKVSSTEKTAKKELKKSQKETKELTKAVKTREQNLQQEEEFLMQLEEGVNDTGVNDTSLKGADDNLANEQKTTTQTKTVAQNDEQNEKIEEKIAEEENINAQIEVLHEEDEQADAKVKKLATKSSVANKKYQKTTKTLSEQNSELKKRSNNLADISQDTVIVGAGTLVKSVISTALGNSLVATGVPLIPDPVTHTEGVALEKLGKEWQNTGRKELKYGLAAVATGAIGLVTSATADDEVSDANSTNKSLTSAVKSSKQSIKEAGAGTETTSETSTTTSATDQTTTTEETSSAADQTAETSQPAAEETPSNSEQTAETEETPSAATQPPATEETPSAAEETSSTADQTENSEEYSVSMKFSSENSVNATQTTNQVTSEMLQSARSVNKQTTDVTAEAKKSEELVKNITKETEKVQKQQEQEAQELQTLTTELENADTPEAEQAVKAEIATISADSDNTNLSKIVASNENQLTKFRKNSSDLISDKTSLDTILSNQLKVAEKTLVVGVGTGVQGVLHSLKAQKEITLGTSLMSSPFTFSAGLKLTILGGLTLAQGMTEVTTGAVAAATGANGISSNSDAKSIAQDAAAANKQADNKYKETDKNIQNSTKEVDKTETQLEQEQQNIPDTEEEETDENVLAGSASANSNITNNTETDDKADRKLTRFNTDSMIESKKKRKKVMAVSASSNSKS